MSSIVPFAYGALTAYLVQRWVISSLILFSNSRLEDDNYSHYTYLRNYKRVTLVNKESLENMGYTIDVKNSPGWFTKHITEITISKKSADTADVNKEEEYNLLKKAVRESDFHITHVEDGEVEKEYIIERRKKLE